MTEQEFEEYLGQTYARVGYLVVGFTGERDIGDIIPTVFTANGIVIQQPMRIVSQVDRSEYVAQKRADGMSPLGHEGNFYYRCESD